MVTGALYTLTTSAWRASAGWPLTGSTPVGAESYAKSAIGAHAELRGNEAKDVQGNGLPHRQKP